MDPARVRTLLAWVQAEAGDRTLLLLAAVYAVALAVPFVPGMALGILLMVAFGPRGVLAVYVATLLGLSLSYAAGRLLPSQPSPSTLRTHDHPAPQPRLVCTMLQMISDSRVGRHIPIRLSNWLSSHRHLALAVCLNLPGNAVLGGGGGIALLCGLSRQFCYPRYLVTVAMAISPVPLLMLMGFFGLDIGALDALPMHEALQWLAAQPHAHDR